MPRAARPRATGIPEVAAHLPVQLTSFVGRETELAEIDSLIRSSRLVTVTGGAGLGKTRLAIEAARRLASDVVADVWFVSLAGLSDGALAAREVAGRLGIREKAGESLVQTLAVHIGEQPVLLLLDNCEHVVDRTAQLVDPLLRSCPGLRALATSRQPLRVAGEVVWRIAPLSLPDGSRGSDLGAITDSEAVRLFEARARLPEPRFRVGPDNADAVALLCRRLDGIPLAIELAAARLEMLSVEDILTRLEDRFRLLTGGGRMAVARHRTLRAALDWGYQLLDDQERRLFRRVAIFAGGFDLVAAEAVCAGADLEPEAVAGLIFGLVEKSLLVPDQGRSGPTRYHLLETVRRYAAERLAESGEAAQLAASHASYYVALAERAERFERSPQLTEWLGRLEAERDDLRSSLEWCRDHDVEAWLRLASSLGWFWMTRGYFSEGREWLEGALAANSLGAPARARALLALARLSFWQGDYGSAQALCDLCLDLCRREGDDGITGWAMVLLASVAAYQGDYEEGRRRFEALLDTVTRDDLRMEALVGMGEMLLQQGELAAARGRLEAAMAMARGPEAPRGRAALFLGLVDFFGGNYPGARAHYALALDVFHRLGNRYAVAGAFDAVAALAMVDSKPERALRLTGAAAALRDATRTELAPRWRDVVRAVIIDPASEAAGERAAAAWGEGERMTLDDAVQYARAGLRLDLAPKSGASRALPRRLAGLSARELEVAGLVAQGLTNRQIAGRLGIAERTVEGHVERVRNKLKVRSRTQVAVTIARQRAWPSG